MFSVMNRFSRTENLIGKEGVSRLRRAKVSVVGLGGVGGYVLEGLARAGVGAFVLTDGDVVSETDLNRQISALVSTIGRPKTEVLAERVRDINPDAEVTVRTLFFPPPEGAEDFFSGCSFVVDAVDDVPTKIAIISAAKAAGVPVISAMGAGGKLYGNFRIGDISGTRVCPLARAVRRELRARGITDVPVCWSEEEPVVRDGPSASISYVPSAMGLAIAGEVIRRLAADGAHGGDI